MLLQFPLAMFAQVTSNIIEALVSITRLEKFFRAEELQGDARTLANTLSVDEGVIGRKLEEGDEVLRIENGEFKWSREAEVPILEDVNLAVKKGELVGMMGRVGAGKTSLLSAIVGEMYKADGQVKVSGCISYAPQNPWCVYPSNMPYTRGTDIRISIPGS